MRKFTTWHLPVVNGVFDIMLKLDKIFPVGNNVMAVTDKWQGNNMTLSEYVKTARESLGLKKIELAANADISLSYLGRIESGKRTPKNVEVLAKLAKALNKPFDEIKVVALLENTAKPPISLIKPKTSREALKELAVILDNTIQVPIVASMHAPGRPMDYIDFPKSFVPASHKKIYAVKVTGDCMSPEVEDGDLLIVDKDDVPDIGKKVLCYHNGEEHPCIIKIKKRSDVKDCDMYGVILWIMRKP